MMDHRRSSVAPCVKTGAQVIITRVLLKQDVVDRAHRMGWISTSEYKKLVKTKELEDISDLPCRIPDISRKEDSFSTRLEYDNDNFKENEIPVYSDSLSRKRKRDDVVDVNLSSPPSSPLRACRGGRIKQPTVQKAQSVPKEVRRPSVELNMDSTKKTKNVDEGPHSSLNLSKVSSSSNTSDNNVQKMSEMGGAFERQKMGITEEGEVFKQKETPLPTLEKGTESDYIMPAKVSSGGSIAKPVQKKLECISSSEVTGNEMPVNKDVQITNQILEIPCGDNERIALHKSDTLPQVESLLSTVDTMQQNVVEGICTEKKVSLQSGNDRSRTDDEKFLTSDDAEENLICEASQVEDIQVSKETKTFTQSLSDEIYDKLRQDFVGETCVHDGSWKSMDGKDNSNKENEALSSKDWEKKMDNETFEMLLKNAVVASVFQSPEAQEQRNKIEKYQEKLAQLEIENRRLQDVTANLKSLMNDLEKGIDRKSTRGTQVNLDVDLKRISERQKDGNVAPVTEVSSVRTNPNSSATASSVSLPKSSVPFGTSYNYIDYLHNLLSSSQQTDDNSGGQCNQREVPENRSEAVKKRVSGKSPEQSANASELVVKKEPHDDNECNNSSSVLRDSFSTTAQSLPIGHFASISTNYAYNACAAPSTVSSSNAPPLNTVPPMQHPQYPRTQMQTGVQEYPHPQASSPVQGIYHQNNQPQLQVQTPTASEGAQVRAHRMQIPAAFLAQGQHQQFLPQWQQQFLPQQQQQQLHLQRQHQLLLQQRQHQLLLQQPIGQNYLHSGALSIPVSSYENRTSLYNPRMMNVRARPPSMPRLQTTVNQAVYNPHQPQPSPAQPFSVSVESANIGPPNSVAPKATSLSTNNGQLHRHNASYREWSLDQQQQTQQRLRLQRVRALEYQRYKQEQMRIQQQSPQAKNKTTTLLSQPMARSSSQNKFSTIQNIVTRDITYDNAATGQEPNPTVPGSTSSAVAISRKLPVEADKRGDHHSSQIASSKILILTPPTTPSSLSPPGIVDNQVRDSGTSSVAATEVISSAKRSLDTPPMPIVDKIDSNPQTLSAKTHSTAVLEPVVSSRNKLQDSRASTQYEESNSPPKPSVSVAFVQGNVVLSWNMIKIPLTPIAKYQLYSYLIEDLAEVTGNPWRNIGTMAALPLPMACSLTEFEAGLTYCFAVSAVDIYGRMGPLSTPSKVTVTKDGEGND